MTEKHILDFFPEEFERTFVEQLDAPGYRARQIQEQVFKKRIVNPENMTVLPADLRSRVADFFDFSLPVIKLKREAADGTIKYLFRLSDGVAIESVLIPEGKRRTVCFSTQAGCPVGCRFCATGQGGFRRNLTVAEITGQILAIEIDQDAKVTNGVAMGQGEPLLNRQNVCKAIRILNDARLMGLSSRHLTLSTVGIPEGIKAVADERLPCKLAISLHSAVEDIRIQLIPISARYPLSELKKALRHYADVTKNRITFEYLMLAGVNDRTTDCRALMRFAAGLPVFINVIPWNCVAGMNYRESGAKVVRSFARELEAGGFSVAVRKEKGRDIEAACGQLTQRTFLD